LRIPPLRQRTYRTGLVTLGDDEPHQPKPPFVGAGWKATLRPRRLRPTRVSEGREIILSAHSWVSAQRALDLIEGCHRVLRGDPSAIPQSEVIAHNNAEPVWMEEWRRPLLAERFVSTGGFPLACAMAAKASRRLRFVYAVSKYKFSIFLYSVYHVDLEPFSSQHLAVSSFPWDHVMFSHAIISAYSAIEDLGLELRASSRNPSRINGQWNPIVKQELEARLLGSHVDLTETILWTIRGPRRKTERKRAIPAIAKADWARWTVRDSEVHITDAIAYADWLRDCVASHGVKNLTKVLSPYDVVNVQHLARRLILESLGFWRELG
jgi:hypothetical protein